VKNTPIVLWGRPCWPEPPRYSNKGPLSGMHKEERLALAACNMCWFTGRTVGCPKGIIRTPQQAKAIELVVKRRKGK